MTLRAITRAVQRHQLDIYGAWHPDAADAPDGVRTLVLLGPLEPGFWAQFTTSPEYRDGQPDPLDRWSTRIIGGLAGELSCQAFFPFGGPPYQPFIKWAQDSGRAHISPVGLLVHDTAGLMVSYRGALGFAEPLELPNHTVSPCLTCKAQPCRTACPVDALKGDHYDVDTCKADLDRTGNDCMTKGCAVRRICPVSQSYGRSQAQSAFHMEAFK